MNEEFDYQKAKDHLFQKSKQQDERLEQLRISTLENTVRFLKEFFKNSSVEVYLVGSLIQTGKFTENSDIDIVLKKFKGDRFEIWSIIEDNLRRKIEIILYENSNIKDHIDKNGFKVL